MDSQAKIQDFQKRINLVVGQLTTLHLHRNIFRRYAEIVEGNEEVLSNGALFHNWVIDEYVSFVTMSIRRQTETRGSDIYSFAKLLKLMASDASLLTREWNRTLYTKVNSSVGDSMATGAYDQVAGVGRSLTAEILTDDLNSLTEASAQIEEFATNRIAHNLLDKPVELKTLSEVDTCIDFITDIARRYQVLLTAASSRIVPEIMVDWDDVFLKPWIIRSSENQ